MLSAGKLCLQRSARSAVRSLSAAPVRRASSGEPQEVRLDYLDGEHQGIVVLAMNRPHRMNAIGKLFASQLDESISKLKEDRTARAVVMKSDVPGVFCAGADLKERKEMKSEDVGPMVARFRSRVTELGDLPMPVIGALDGSALGGGLEIALGLDIRIAADNAKLGLVETRWSIIPGAGGAQRLPRLIGIGKAKELIFTAKVLNGKEAEEIGLVEHVVPQNSDSNAAYLKALEIAKEICARGPVAVRLAKQAINNGMQIDLSTALRVEESFYAQTIPLEDRVEGLKAFKEKRDPVYKGK